MERAKVAERTRTRGQRQVREVILFILVAGRVGWNRTKCATIRRSKWILYESETAILTIAYVTYPSRFDS